MMDYKVVVKDVPVKPKYDIGRITLEEDGTFNCYLPSYIPHDPMIKLFTGTSFTKVWLDAAAYVAEHGDEIQAKYLHSGRLEELRAKNEEALEYNDRN